MNPLSLLNTAARASGIKDADSYGPREDATPEPSAQDSAFARMLNAPSTPDPATQAKPKAPAPASRRAPEGPRSDEEGQTKDSAAKPEGHDDSSSRTERAPAGKQAGKQADASTDNEASEPAEAAASDGQASTNKPEDVADTWPPPGLGGFGLMLLQPAMPASADPAVAATANPAAALPPTLLQSDARAATAPATGGAAAAAGIALPGLATTAAAGTPAAADADALAALAAANLAGQVKLADAGTADAATPGIDSPVFVLPNLPHATAASRTPDASAVFSASPTPTPDLHGDGFDEAVGTRLTWLAEQKIGHAHIKITPNDLGPVEVHLQMDGDKVHASFTAAHVDVRQALEQSLPRLRDMLGEHGFQLAHADVGAQQQGQREGGSGRSGPGGLDPASSDEATSVVVPASVLRARGLLDAYA
ncbi:MAG TPA: flagellar hook-length control protein FliK [Stenotrophomonas sp.]|nr:flagellar hook-length control protein FliK [Stenotrophomonas sp.]